MELTDDLEGTLVYSSDNVEVGTVDEVGDNYIIVTTGPRGIPESVTGVTPGDESSVGIPENQIDEIGDGWIYLK